MEVAQIRDLMWRGCRHRGCCAAHIEQSGEPTAEQLQDIDHSGARVAYRWICASPDEIFDRDRWPRWACGLPSAWPSKYVLVTS
jgi:hypothetical protein